jgi:putative transposase
MSRKTRIYSTTAWVVDLTYVSTWSGFACLAFLVDADARRILGWRVASTMTTSMVLDAIEQSIWTRQQEGVLDLKDVVHHMDRESQGGSTGRGNTVS